jgi:hypothetical protein
MYHVDLSRTWALELCLHRQGTYHVGSFAPSPHDTDMACHSVRFRSPLLELLAPVPALTDLEPSKPTPTPNCSTPH